MKIMVNACLAGENCKYDGSFSGKLANGSGVTAELLIKNGFRVIDVEDIDEYIDFGDREGIFDCSAERPLFYGILNLVQKEPKEQTTQGLPRGNRMREMTDRRTFAEKAVPLYDEKADH